MSSGGTLEVARFGMSSWAKASDWVGFGGNTGAGFTAPITLTIFDGTGGTLGAQLFTTTSSQYIPYRPEADATCPGGTAWRDQTGACFNGMAFEIAFAPIGWLLPQDIGYVLSYNTQTVGYNPTGTPTPMNSINVGLLAGLGGTTVGSTINALYDMTTGGMTVDDGSYGYSTLAEFRIVSPGSGGQDVVPEPATMTLLATGLAGMAAARRRKAKRS
ncbi:MAG: PEP-CTERM sorting domain-containing protein [Gemmatimonadetes bacterium]|nr:PEP-CTERM sorting domain-containing protein [Gemmatimonadota bacterium]